MARNLDSKTGARMVIASNDHCPPHVHARHKEEGWVVRLWFSFGSKAVGVMSIAPTGNAVRQRQLNQMLDEIMTNLGECRKVWWEGKTTTCLDNKWLMRTSSGEMDVLDDRRAGAMQVRSATYDVNMMMTAVTFWDGSEARIENRDV